MSDTPERISVEVPPAQVPEGGMGPSMGQEQGAAPERPETYLEKLEKHGAQVRADDFTQQVVSDQGQPLITPIPSNVTTITVPVNQQQLLDWAKGDPDNSLTWLAKFWIRSIKKAVHYGWHLIIPPDPVQQVQTQPIQQVQQAQQLPSVQGGAQ